MAASLTLEPRDAAWGRMFGHPTLDVGALVIRLPRSYWQRWVQNMSCGSGWMAMADAFTGQILGREPAIQTVAGDP